MVRAAWPLALAVAFAVLACAEAAPGPLAGASDAWQSARELDSTRPAQPAQPGPLPVWDSYAELQHWPAASAPFTSQGHQPQQTVEVRTNELARTAYATLVTDTLFPDGAQLVECSHGSGHSYAMRKANAAWSYFELDSRGGVLASGALPLCAGCHAQAPADRVFGPPRGS